jgi:hypothetical protein
LFKTGKGQKRPSKVGSTKVCSSKVQFNQSPVCSKIDIYQIPFYQSPFLPKSGFAGIFSSKVHSTTCLLENDILPNFFLPKYESTEVRFASKWYSTKFRSTKVSLVVLGIPTKQFKH